MEINSRLDIAAILNLPVVRSVGNRFLGEDPLSSVAGLDEYCARMEEREHIKNREDARADQVGFMAHAKKSMVYEANQCYLSSTLDDVCDARLIKRYKLRSGEAKKNKQW